MINAETHFIAFDTETTGLSAAEGRIVEIAALKFDWEGKILDKFAELVNPGAPIPATAMRIHHITDEMVAEKPDIADVLGRFIDFIASDNIAILAQNASFDIGFINHEAIATRIIMPKTTILDQIDITRSAFPTLTTYGLENVCRSFNLVDTQSHRAMADSVLVMKLFLHCKEKFGSQEKMIKILNSLNRYTFGGPLITRIDERMTEMFVRAMDSGATMEIVYRGGSYRGKPRHVKPILLFNRDGVGYITAKCLLSNSNKQFRLDRITDYRIIDESLKFDPK